MRTGGAIVSITALEQLKAEAIDEEKRNVVATILVIEIKPPVDVWTVVLENELGDNPTELYQGESHFIAWKWFNGAKELMVIGDTLLIYRSGKLVKKVEKDT